MKISSGCTTIFTMRWLISSTRWCSTSTASSFSTSSTSRAQPTASAKPGNFLCRYWKDLSICIAKRLFTGISSRRTCSLGKVMIIFSSLTSTWRGSTIPRRKLWNRIPGLCSSARRRCSRVSRIQIRLTSGALASFFTWCWAACSHSSMKIFRNLCKWFRARSRIMNCKLSSRSIRPRSYCSVGCYRSKRSWGPRRRSASSFHGCKRKSLRGTISSQIKKGTIRSGTSKARTI